MASISEGLCWIGLSLSLGSACTFNPDNEATFDDTGEADAAANADGSARADARGACPGDAIPVVMLNVDSCDLPVTPMGALDFDIAGSYLIDTDSGLVQNPLGATSSIDFKVVGQDGDSELFLLSADSMRVRAQSRVTVIGARPLVVVSFSNIEIEGVLAARGQGATHGAGGNLDSACALGRGSAGTLQTDENDNPGGSGGGGGGFGAPGGNGAIVSSSGAEPTAGGQATVDLGLVPLRGGCAGGIGGDALGGVGGYAGGAIQLIAAEAVRIDGRLTASGGGGTGADDHGGGGGGGSGGGLLVQTPSLRITGVVTANGGGGGEGSRTFASASGGDGREGSADVAPGGGGTSAGGDGGRGGALDSEARDGEQGSLSVPNAAGGGGGGGSVGVIRLLAPSLDIEGGAVVSPAPQVE